MFEIGDVIGGYKLLAQCGQGAYGAVFLAENGVTKMSVAIKIVPLLGHNGDREIAGLRQYQTICRHSNLLQIYHVWRNQDYLCYTMDAADSLTSGSSYTPDTLANRLKRQKNLDPDSVRAMVAELQENLTTLHQKGLLHRDIKPDNVLWINHRAVLGDIGLVTNQNSPSLAGTPQYLPSEVLAGLREYTPEDDFYALGCVIYCALTGLPIEKYPAWPAELTINQHQDLIQKYNHWINHTPLPPSSVTRPEFKTYKYALAIVAGAVLIGVIALFYHADNSPVEFPPSPAATPLPDAEFSDKIPEWFKFKPAQLPSQKNPELQEIQNQYEKLAITWPQSGKADRIELQYTKGRTPIESLIIREPWYPELCETIRRRPPSAEETRKIKNIIKYTQLTDTPETFDRELATLRDIEIKNKAYLRYRDKKEFKLFQNYNLNKMQWKNNCRYLEDNLAVSNNIPPSMQQQFIQQAIPKLKKMSDLIAQQTALIHQIEKLPQKK